MLFINSRVNIMLAEAKKEIIKTRLGEAASILPGQSEDCLMIELAEFCDLSFQGDRTKPADFLEVRILEDMPESSMDEMTRAICEIYEEELQIKRDRIYVEYEKAVRWGWNGRNR